jgi:hypothetical protein
MEKKDIYSELSSIRNLMERSTKFISLSGLSGILAGIYALIGTYFGNKIIYASFGALTYRNYLINDYSTFLQLTLVALSVLVLSISTCVWLTYKQARKKQENIFSPASKKMLKDFSIPFFTGCVFIAILIFNGQFALVAPASLIFYGLGLIFSSNNTFSDIKWLGTCEIYCGLSAALFPNLGIMFWAIGFGVLHIFYGSIMHFKYKQ